MIELSDIKKHLNVDFDEDDDLIQSMVDAVVVSVEKSIDTPLSEFAGSWTGAESLFHELKPKYENGDISFEDLMTTMNAYERNIGVIPADLMHVIRIMVAKLYEYREGNTYGKVQEVPYTLAHLLAPYIKLT